MDKLEAIRLLDEKMKELKMRGYATFESWIYRRHIEFIDVRNASGQSFKIEVQAVYDDQNKPYGNIRVLATIDDGHLRTLTKSFPMIKQFVIAPDDRIMSE